MKYYYRNSERDVKDVEIGLDVDYFKEYNDKYGHCAGEQCLINISNTVNVLAKSYGGDLYRYGGDEFALFLKKYPLPKGYTRVKLMERTTGLSYLSEW